tara:strand:+ start:27 stop:431 length:405 start_codon:yes stop_codon:yes gene_type:complete
MNEHSFIKSVHRTLPSEIFKWKIHDTFTGGVPDAFYCGPAGSLFIEYKFIKLPKKPSTKIKLNLSKLQLALLERMSSFNQNVAVVVGFTNNNKTHGVIMTNLKEWTNTYTNEYYLDSKKSIAKITQFINNQVLG